MGGAGLSDRPRGSGGGSGERAAISFRASTVGPDQPGLAAESAPGRGIGAGAWMGVSWPARRVKLRGRIPRAGLLPSDGPLGPSWAVRSAPLLRPARACRARASSGAADTCARIGSRAPPTAGALAVPLLPSPAVQKPLTKQPAATPLLRQAPRARGPGPPPSEPDPRPAACGQRPAQTWQPVPRPAAAARTHAPPKRRRPGVARTPAPRGPVGRARARARTAARAPAAVLRLPKYGESGGSARRDPSLEAFPLACLALKIAIECTRNSTHSERGPTLNRLAELRRRVKAALAGLPVP